MPRKVKPVKDKSCNCTCHKQNAKLRAPRKPPSAAQLAAREKFKAQVAEAKKIREQHPDWAMSKCIKMVAPEAK
jgi:hypothetical protein